MKSINRLRIPIIVLCLLGLVTLLMFACGNEDETTSTVLATSTTTTEGPTDTSEVPSVVTPEGYAQVPQLVEKLEADAKTILAGLGLGSKSSPYYISDPTSTGWVATQDVAPGTIVPIGTIIKIGIAADGTEVPDVVGMSKDDAEDALEIEDFVAAVVYQTTANHASWGMVISQDPAAHVVAETGGTVKLTVGKQPPTNSTLVPAPTSSIPVFNP